MDRALDDAKLRELADELWPRLEAYELGQATRHLEIEGISYLAMVFWNQIRQTDYIRQQVAYVVNGWYDRAGDTPVLEILEDLGVTRAQVVREVVALGTPLMRAWVRSGHVEARLRDHIGRFMADPATRALLGSPA